MEAVQKNKQPMPLSLVPALTDKTFPTTIQGADIALVYFYIPCKYKRGRGRGQHEVVEAVQKNKQPMPLSLVPALTDKTFPTTIQGADIALVYFYIPCKYKQGSGYNMRFWALSSRITTNATESCPCPD